MISSAELEQAISDTARMVEEMKPYANILPQDKDILRIVFAENYLLSKHFIV